jgi:hypothetical protein
MSDVDSDEGERPIEDRSREDRRGKQLCVFGYFLLAFGVGSILVSGWYLTMWATTDHAKVGFPLGLGASCFGIGVLLCSASGYVFYQAARADRRAAGIPEPEKLLLGESFSVWLSTLRNLFK